MQFNREEEMKSGLFSNVVQNVWKSKITDKNIDH